MDFFNKAKKALKEVLDDDKKDEHKQDHKRTYGFAPGCTHSLNIEQPLMPIVVRPTPTSKVSSSTARVVMVVLLLLKDMVLLPVSLNFLQDGRSSGIRTASVGKYMSTLLSLSLTDLRYFVEQATGRTQWDPPAFSPPPPMGGYSAPPPPPGQYG